ncbi:MAG TPA: AmmeMemoRadiSam system protein B [Nitrospirota bacterium]|nr:AmmeMemoRadiSam system protein B [Nitrospirota bacterium]
MEKSMVRHAAVAGYFYRGSPEELRKQVSEFVTPAVMRKKAIGVVVPHAGLIYSGSVAGAVYSSIELPDTIVLIGPNHTGLGAPVSLMAKGAWETPLGVVSIDETLAAAILSKSTRIQENELAHLREHSLEVQLPFIQYLKSDFKIVPIQMLDTRLEICQELGKAVASAIMNSRGGVKGREENSKAVLIVASSDMTHYEKASAAKEKDMKAIQQILNLNPQGLYRTVQEFGITMCGYGPAVAMLTAAHLLGATKAEMVKYANSGETSGDFDQVVGYAGIIVM